MTQKKWVIPSGAGRERGDAGYEDAARRQGANLAESRAGVCRCRGVYAKLRFATRSNGSGGSIPMSWRVRLGRASLHLRQRREEIRRCVQFRLGERALGGARIDAGDDGYGAKSRLERRDSGRAGETSGDPALCYDSYRRFIQMYSDVVLEGSTARSRNSGSQKDANDYRRRHYLTAEDWVGWCVSSSARWSASLARVSVDPKENSGRERRVFFI